MQSILFRGSADDHSMLVADLWELQTLGIVQEEIGFRAFFDAHVSLTNILESYSAIVVETRVESVPPPGNFSCEAWDPVLVGERFIIAPSWVEVEPSSRIRLAVDATTAFGTGRHESTQLALQALERHVDAGVTVLDVGCGSGILSAAATALGAGTVIACDVHPSAALAAHEYLQSPVFLGAIDAVRDCCADIVVANISRPVIEAFASDLNRVAKPEGLIVLGGFLEDNLPSSFVPIETTQLDGWVCWVCRPQSVAGERSNQQHRLRNDAEHWW